MNDNKGHEYEIVTYWEHMVSEYAKISIFDVQELDYMDYLQLRRDAFINTLNQTEKGKEYLDNAWRLEQTKPDRGTLRKQFGRKGGD